MHCYNYDRETGEYLGQSTVRESPREPGVYLLPAHATETAPPAAEPGHAVCWREGAWVQVPDFRGQVRWDAAGQRVEITGLGPLPEGLTDVEPAPPPPDYKALAQAALDRSDVTVVRCVSAGLAVPAEWQAYRVALRAIVNSGVGPLPARPDYPAGS